MNRGADFVKLLALAPCARTRSLTCTVTITTKLRLLALPTVQVSTAVMPFIPYIGKNGRIKIKSESFE
jgi:hypothetical protein